MKILPKISNNPYFYIKDKNFGKSIKKNPTNQNTGKLTDSVIIRFKTPEAQTPSNNIQTAQKAKIDTLINNLLEFAKNNGFTVTGKDEYVENRIFDSSGKQVGVIYKTDDGSIYFDFNTENNILIDFIEKNLSKDIIYVKFHPHTDSDVITYQFYQNITLYEENILKTKVEPINGYKIVVQGEFSIVKVEENLLIGTFGIASCRGFLIYDPINGIAAVGHCDFDNIDIKMIEAMKEALIREGADPNNLIFVGSPHIGGEFQEHFRGLIKGMFKEAYFNLPDDFVFDLKTLKILPFDIKSIPDSKNQEIRLNEKTNIRLKYNIPWIES